MPEHGLVQLLELQKEGLVVVEVQVEGGSPAAGKKAGGLQIPEGSRLISVFRQGRTELVEPSTVLRPGDQVLAVVPTNAAADLRRALLGAPKYANTRRLPWLDARRPPCLRRLCPSSRSSSSPVRRWGGEARFAGSSSRVASWSRSR